MSKKYEIPEMIKKVEPIFLKLEAIANDYISVDAELTKVLTRAEINIDRLVIMQQLQKDETCQRVVKKLNELRAILNQ